MTNMANITRPNAVNGSQTNTYAAKYATSLKLFSGEVFSSFNDACVFKELVRNYTLQGGKSKQFLLTGQLSAGWI